MTKALIVIKKLKGNIIFKIIIMIDLTNFKNEVLNRQNLKQITGGSVMEFECYCGFVGGPYEHLKFYVQADNITDALNNSANCGGAGKTCSAD